MTEAIVIAVEGLDGAGKDVAIEAIKSRLESQGVTYKVVQEPGSSPVGQQIRSILKDPSNVIDPLTEMMLFTASRTNNIQYLPNDVDVIIFNRWYFSTAAYQCFGRNEDYEEGMDFYQHRFLPLLQMSGALKLYHRHLVIRCDPKVALERARASDEKCRLEQFDEATYERIANAYEALEFSSLSGVEGNAEIEFIDNDSDILNLQEQCYTYADEIVAEVAMENDDGSIIAVE